MAVNSFIKSLRKSTGSSSFKDSKYGEVKNWISTGSYALNRIISGSVYKGIPCGKVVIFAGENSTGKSLITNSTAVNALKDGYDQVVIFDSEGGVSVDFLENLGADTNKIEQVLVESVEDAQLKILGAYTGLMEHQQDNPDYKCLFILDSLGALVAGKVLNDVEKGKVVSEMGGRAKIVNNMVKALTIPALKTDCSILVLNHVYCDPSCLFPSKIKNQGGGLGLQHMAHVNIQCSKKFEKAESKDEVESEYKGNHMIFFTVKNRVVKPFYRTEFYIDFAKGAAKYDGIVEPAIDYGLIENPKQGYFVVPDYSDKMLRRKDLIEGDKADDIWATILDKFDEMSMEDLSYSRVELEELEEVKEEEVKNDEEGIK